MADRTAAATNNATTDPSKPRLRLAQAEYLREVLRSDAWAVLRLLIENKARLLSEACCSCTDDHRYHQGRRLGFTECFSDLERQIIKRCDGEQEEQEEQSP